MNSRTGHSWAPSFQGPCLSPHRSLCSSRISLLNSPHGSAHSLCPHILPCPHSSSLPAKPDLSFIPCGSPPPLVLLLPHEGLSDVGGRVQRAQTPPAFTMDTSLPAWQLAGCSGAPRTALSHLAGLAYLFGCGLYVWPLCNGEHGAVSAENTHSTAADGWTASNVASRRGYHEPMGNQKEDHYASWNW